MKTNTATKGITSSRSVIDKLVNTLLPTKNNKGKERETTISPELVPLFEKAHQDTLKILAELPNRLKLYAAYGDGFENKVVEYLHLHHKYYLNGDLHKLEVLTARFDIDGAMDLLKLDINIDTLVAYVFRETCATGTKFDDEAIFECKVCSSPNAPTLFETPGIDFDELRNEYSYRTGPHGESYWICYSTCLLQASDCGYNFTIKERRLTMKEMWQEITAALQQGHALCDEDCNPLTRQDMIQHLKVSKL